VACGVASGTQIRCPVGLPLALVFHHPLSVLVGGVLSRWTAVLEKQRKNREKKQIRQQNKKKKGKKNKGSKKNVSSNVRVDGFENTDANL